jgi:hypothetical protein
MHEDLFYDLFALGLFCDHTPEVIQCHFGHITDLWFSFSVQLNQKFSCTHALHRSLQVSDWLVILQLTNLHVGHVRIIKIGLVIRHRGFLVCLFFFRRHLLSEPPSVIGHICSLVCTWHLKNRTMERDFFGHWMSTEFSLVHEVTYNLCENILQYWQWYINPAMFQAFTSDSPAIIISPSPAIIMPTQNFFSATCCAAQRSSTELIIYSRDAGQCVEIA